MADTSNLTNYLTDVADSIREKTHSNELIPAREFDEKILSIATDTTANPTEILSGKTAYIDGDKVTGTYPIQYKKLDDITSDNTTLDTPIEANMKLLPVGNTTQEVISAVEGTIVSGIDITINDYDNTKESRFTKFDGDTTQVTSIIPSEYQQVEYIESTGTQYIDTGYVPQGNSEIQADIQCNRGVSELTNGRIFGTVDTNKSLTINFGEAENSYQNIFVWNGRGYNSGEPLLQIYLNLDFINQRHKYILNNNGLKIDNTLHEKQGVAIASVYSIALFTVNRDSGVNQNCGKYKLYTCKIYEGQTLVRDFIPCYRKSDNEIGLYDLVNNVFYTNQGDGTFLKGSNISIPNLDYPQEIQVVKGSNNVKVENKNLFNLGTNRITKNGVDITINGSELILNGTCDGWAAIDINLNILLKRTNSYYLSIENFTNDVPVNFTTPQGILYNNVGLITNKSKITVFQLQILQGKVYNNLNYKIQLEESSSKTSYIAHQEQNYPITLPTGMVLAKIGNYRDYIYKNKDNWYKKEYVRHIQLPFSTLGNTSNPGWANVPYIKNDYPNKNDSLKNMTALKSNITIENSSSIRINTMSSNSTIFLYSASFGGLTGAQLKEKYPNLILDLYYGVEVPTDIQITDTTLIGQLEAIEEATGYAGTTYIITTNSNDLAIVPTYKYNYVTPAPSPERESEIQVVKGSNNVKVQNKNYLDISKCVMGANNTTVDTTITYSTKTNRACTKFDVNPIYVKPSTTYIIKIDSTYNFSVAQLNSRNRVLSDSGWKSANFSFTTSANCQKITMNFKKSNDANFTIEEFKTAEFQVEKGSTATSFIPHQEQNYPITLPTGMELCKIGNNQDYIYKNLMNGNWYKHSEIGKIILNGTETWTYQSQYPRFYTTNISEIFKTGGSAYSTHYLRDDTGTINNTFDFWTDGTNKQCLIHDERFDTETSLNNWLSSNNVICYGRLKTPIDTQITDTTLVNQLNEIYNNAKTYYDKTNIIITAEENNATMQLKIKIPTQGIDTSEVTATSDDIILGKTAVINNQVVIGTSVAVVVSDTTALASDVAYGKVFYLADGTKAIGTYVQEDLNTELTALEGQVTTLQTALDGKSSSQINQQEYEEAVNQVEDLLGESEE